MELKDKKIGFCFTDSFYTYKNTFIEVKNIMKKGGVVFPIMSEYAYLTDSKFGRATDFIKEIEKFSRRKVIHEMQEAEYIANSLDILVIAPCSGNTIAKLANSITDDSVLVSARSILKDSRPIIIGLCSKDGLSSNAENIGKLLNKKDMFFVPFRQDNPITKPYSICYDCKSIIKTIEHALDKVQIQPLLI